MQLAPAEVREERQSPTATKRIIAFIVIGFSLYYFAVILTRAWEKQLWFDELVTVYMCRLPTLRAVQQALAHGVDFNPLFFYVISRASRAVFGENSIGMRIPQILGLWIFCLSLFRFVYRRAGILAGLIAMTFPTLTNCLYYGYEARPHGMILGFCGLAITFWQLATEKPEKTRYTIAFGLSLLGAFMLHCFAFLLVGPFAIVELWKTWEYRRINWRMWSALVAPVVVAAATYLPLFLAFKAQATGNDLYTTFPPSITEVNAFFHFLFATCMPVVVVALALLIAEKVLVQSRYSDNEFASAVRQNKFEVILGVAFLAMPVFGLFPSAILHAPYFHRYFLSATAGFCILIGFAMKTKSYGLSRWVPLGVATVMACSIGWQFAALAWHALRGKAEDLWEPSAGIQLNTTPRDPLAVHKLLKTDAKQPLPVVVLRSLEYLYLTYYSPDLRSRAYYLTDTNTNPDFQSLTNFHQWCSTDYNPPQVISDFVRAHPDFFVYGDVGFMKEFIPFANQYGRVKSIQYLKGHFLAEVVQ